MSRLLTDPGSEPITPGSTVILTALFTDATSGAEPLEPPQVTLIITDPDGADLTGITPSKVSKGVWDWEGEPEAPGRYYFRFDGDGVDAVEGTFVIAKSKVR